MNNGKQAASQWGWLKDPDVALELYNAERRAFFEWDAAATEWSKATRVLNSRGERPSQEDEDTLKELKKRLDQAAKAYDIARTKLHAAWAA